MSDLRTAAQQALTILEAWKHKGMWGDWDGVTDALKAALVEDAMQKFTDVNQELEAALAEPENWELRRLREELERCKQVCAATSEAWREEAALGCDHCNHPLYAAIRCRVCGRETPIIEPEIKGDNKPVAWIHTDPDKPRVKFLEWRKNEPGYRGDWIKTPLYAAPPQRKPEPNSDYERGFVDGMSEQARRSVDKAVNAMIKCKPLAEEEIARLVTNDMVKFARAIERAHGIGEQQ